jgi:hypothetical protein
MSYKWGRGLVGLVLLALLACTGYSITAYAESIEISIPVLITGGVPSEWGLQTYSREFTVHFQRDERIILSARDNGTGDIFVHTSLEIKVIHPNGSIAGRVIDFWPPDHALSPQDITSMFAGGQNKVFITLFSKDTASVSSWSLRLVRLVTISSYSELISEIERSLGEMLSEAEEFRNSWRFDQIHRWLRIAPHYANRSRYAFIAERLIDEARDLLNDIAPAGDVIGPKKLVIRIEQQLPELRGEIGTLLMEREFLEGPAEQALQEIEELHRFLCSLDNSLNGCEDTSVIVSATKRLFEIKEGLKQVDDLLQDVLNRLRKGDLAEARAKMGEADNFLMSTFRTIDEIWWRIRDRISKLQRYARQMKASLRRHPLNHPEDWRMLVPATEFCLHLDPLRGGMSVTVQGSGVESVRLQVFALDGKLVLNKTVEGSYLQFSPLDDEGQPLANGVYLYVVTVKGYDGTEVKSEIHKLVVLR